MNDMQPYWGEIHTHTALSDGNGTLEENFSCAESHLDFWAAADHAYDPEVFDLDYRVKGGEILNDHWSELQAMCRERERPGEFIPFLAYEWTNFQYGHHNVYYLEYDEPLRMPPTLPELYRELSGSQAIVIPHHTGYAVGYCGKDWDHHDERLTPFAEIYSFHGSSEEAGDLRPMLTWGSWMGPGASGGSVREGLGRGYRLGIMASSDSHLDHPGAYDNGLIAACAEELTRPALWKAFREKRIYGVTGDRIGLGFAVNGAPMGSEMSASAGRRIEIGAAPWDRIDRVDIIRNGRLLRSFVEPSGPATRPPDGPHKVRFHVEWGWDRLMDLAWRGSLRVNGGRVTDAVRCYRNSAVEQAGHGIASLSDKGCEWTSKPKQVRVGSYVRANADAIAFEVEGTDQTRLEFTFEYGRFGQECSLSLADILAGSVVHYMEAAPPVNNGAYWSGMETYAKFKVHRGAPVDEIAVALSLEDEASGPGGEVAEGPGGPGGADYYYARVTQLNGQMAWSSPVWVER